MPPYVFFNRDFIPLAEARIGIMTHALHYGTACFEGIRGSQNEDERQVYLFRLKDHYLRLLQSCQIMKITLPYGVDELCQLTEKLVQLSGYQEDIYIRPLAYKSSQAIGVRLHDLEDDLLIYVATLPAYLDTDKGVSCCISTWRRIGDNMIPPRAKITGLYVNSALAKTEAVESGLDEGIMLTHDGHVSEGSGENSFLVTQGRLVTPSASDNILLGITRDSRFVLCQDTGGAIKGAGRVDFFAGHGPKARGFAFKLWESGKLYLLILKFQDGGRI